MDKLGKVGLTESGNHGQARNSIPHPYFVCSVYKYAGGIIKLHVCFRVTWNFKMGMVS